MDEQHVLNPKCHTCGPVGTATLRPEDARGKGNHLLPGIIIMCFPLVIVAFINFSVSRNPSSATLSRSTGVELLKWTKGIGDM